jgi:tellurite resistance protein TehA-like permease
MAKVGKKIFMDTDFAGFSNSGDVIFIVSVIIGLMIWGLGLWWLVHGMACVIIRMLSTRLQFNMGFWGFIFPLGVFIAGTISLGETLSSAFFSYLSIAFLVLLVLLYGAVAIYTAMGAYNHTLIVAPCMSDLGQRQSTAATP